MVETTNGVGPWIVIGLMQIGVCLGLQCLDQGGRAVDWYDLKY